MILFRRLLTLLLATAMLAAPAVLASGTAHAAQTGDVVQWGDGPPPAPSSLGNTHVTAIAAGLDHSLAITAQGTIIGWGGWRGESNAPASLEGKTVTAVAVGYGYSLALTDDGRITAWGDNSQGLVDVPASLSGKRVTAIAAGERHALALTDDGRVTAWGDNGLGQSTVPASLDGKRVTAIAAGYIHSVAVTDDGRVTSWGYDSWGLTDSPASLNGKRVTAIAAGVVHSLALADDGQVIAWGNDDRGAISVPASLDGKRVTAIAAGNYHSLALTDDGKVTAWGDDSRGATGVPASLAGEKVTAISAAGYGSMALIGSSVSTGLPDGTTTATAGQAAGFTPTVSHVSPPSAWRVTGSDDVDATIDEDTGEVALTSTVAGTHDVTLTVPATGHDITNVVHLVVTPAAVAKLDLTASSTAALYGDTVTISAIGEDSYGNGTGDETADITLASSDGSDTITGTDVTVGAAGSRTLTATHSTTGATGTVAIAVDLRTFSAPPTPTISGTVKVGEELTADTGAIVPTPESVDWQWFADGAPIDAATDIEFTPTSSQEGKKLSVKATASLTGHHQASVPSAETAPVATDQAPSIDFTAGKTNLRRGQSTDLSWSIKHAVDATASGAWSGAKPAAGSATVTPGLNSSTWILSATNENGTTTAQVSTSVTREATTIQVAATDGLILRGKNVTVTASGLDPSEPYAVQIAGQNIATGLAGATGSISQRITIPAGTAPTAQTVRIIGSESDRIGGDTITVVANKKLGVSVKAKKVKASKSQKVTVKGLAPGEKVTITYRGKRISPKGAKANSKGVYSRTFKVGSARGKKTVKVTGQFPGRKGSVKFSVIPRTQR